MNFILYVFEFIVYVVYAVDTGVGHGLLEGPVEVVGQDGLQCLVDEGALTRTADACYNDEAAQRKVYVDAFQVVATASV